MLRRRCWGCAKNLEERSRTREHVKDRKLLLVIDNCEHLVSACASLAEALLQGAPELRILATSREALHIRGEQTYPVLPLAAPDRKASVEVLLRSEAVQLFVERAQLQRPSFTLTERDAPAMAEICARLDGIPLALELAAARMRSLSIGEINTRLQDRFKLLTGGSRVALERQQTLRALVSWSYDLLREQEQMLLDRLSVFAGGFNLQAAEAVCSAEPLVPDDVIDLLDSLVEKSLVMVDQDDGASRYGLLETIREFAREHLTKRYDMQGTIRDFAQERLVDRDDVAATARRHCNFYLELAKAARAEFQGPQQAEWTRCLEVELGNLRAAIALALAGGVDAVIAVKFEVALMQFRRLRGYSTEGRTNLRAALDLPGIREQGVARAHALYVGGVLATNQSDYAEASSMLAECLEIRRSLGNPRETAATLSMLVELHMQQDDLTKARSHEEEAIGIFRELGHRDGEAIGLLNLGDISVRQGDNAGARELFEQCLAIARSIRHQELESESERNLGELELAAGNIEAARARFARSLQVCKEAEDKRGEAISLWRLGRTEAVAGDYESAHGRLAVALPALQAFEMSSEVLDCLEDLASLLQQMGQTEAAVRAYGAAAAVRDAHVLPRSTRRESEKQRRMTIDSARATLGEPAFGSAWSTGQKAGLESGIASALAAARNSSVPA